MAVPAWCNPATELRDKAMASRSDTSPRPRGVIARPPRAPGVGLGRDQLPGDARGLRKALFDWSQADENTRAAWGLMIKNHIATHYTHEQELDQYQELFAGL